MIRHALFAFTLLCAVRTAAAQSDSVPPRVWVNAFTEGATFCLILSRDGSAHFSAGFLTYNPLRWRYDSLTGTLMLSVPRLTARSVAQFRNGAGGWTWVFDTLTKTATYDLNADPRIWWAGWFLYPLTSLDSAGRAGVRRECKVSASFESPAPNKRLKLTGAHK